MADRQITPPGGAPSWANDANLNDPGEAWDGTPTKVDPGAGKRDDGHLPGENPAAQHVNFLANEDKRWIQYLGDLPLLNWRSVGDPGSVARAVVFDEGARAWIVVGDTSSSDSARDGAAFTVEASTGISGPSWIATKPPEATPTHTVGTAKTLIGDDGAALVGEATGAAGSLSWSNLSVPGTAVAGTNGAIWDYVNDLWVVCGDDNGSPSFWSDATAITGFTQASPSGTGIPTVIAHDPATGLTVAVSTNGGESWKSTNGTSWTNHTATGIGENPRAMQWDEVGQRFVIVTTASCYTSTDGIAWVEVKAAKRAFGNFKSLAIAGRAFVSVDSTQSAINYSTDGGITWRMVELRATIDPTVSNGMTAVAYSRIRGHFLAIWSDGSTQGEAFLSLAAGVPLHDESFVEVTPEV